MIEASQIGTLAYTTDALAWVGLLLLLTARGGGRGPGRLLVAAVLVQAAWGAANAMTLAYGTWPLATALIEALRPFAWSAFMLTLLRTWVGTPALGFGIALSAVLAVAQTWLAAVAADPISFALVALVANIYTLLCVEQVYRNATPPYRWASKFLCLAVAAMAALDVALYATAVNAGRVEASAWIARGFAFALAAPLVAVTAARMPSWRLDVRVSRTVVFHSATLLASGLFLLTVAAATYGVRWFGSSYGTLIQILLLFAALVAMVALLASGALRARLRVFVTKHFFSYRFDYRREWLHLTAALARPEGDGEGLPHRALSALADLVDSPGGALWTRRDDGRFGCDARRSTRERDPLPADAPLAGFLATTGWIVDLDEWRRYPGRYQHLTLPPSIADDPDAWLIVPLLLHDDLIGLVQLQRGRIDPRVEWELLDVLKTAGRQVAGHLGVRLAVEKLVQAQQFDSFNRMSAFVVHDLKNLVAQLSLLLGNAPRHRGNPEFQRDMLETVENVLERMQRLLMQLRVGTRPIEQPAPVRLSAVLGAAVGGKRNAGVKVAVEFGDVTEEASVIAHEDRLERVIGHLVQNATEATPPGGSVRVSTRTDGGEAIVEIADTGRGMSRAFVETELFKPFASTKPHGMGIGAFESREYLREIGGSLAVSSIEGVGSTFTVRLPLARSSVAADVTP
ncbi:MAG: PEP-CTERM system histidine kinase PrsK [Burkholderiales bacterium]|nr:PEP-CTERM system histidine kinase PrsK [Burkholderiales bacterium]